MTNKRLSVLVDRIGIFLNADRSEWGMDWVQEDGQWVSKWFVEFRHGNRSTYQDFPHLYKLKRYIKQLNKQLEKGGLYDSAN